MDIDISINHCCSGCFCNSNYISNAREKKDKVKEPNYQVFFIIGMSWLPIGVVFMITINTTIGIAFMGMGTAYIAIGLANRDKWEKKK